MHDLDTYLQQEYVVECGETRIRKKPIRIWVIDDGKMCIILGTFICPDSSTIRKVLKLIPKQRISMSTP